MGTFIQDELLGMAWLRRLFARGLGALGLDVSAGMGGAQGFYRYLNVAALPCSLIPTPPDDEQSPGIFHLQEDFE